MSVASQSDTVRDSKLRATTSRSLTHHTYYISKPGVRRQMMEESWRRRHQLGSGASGSVWLEQCETGLKQGELRAVKQMMKHTARSYEHEIDAMVKFSHENYVHCFIRFFGWYESQNNLYIAMEYLELGDLQKYLDTPLPEAEAKQITAQLAEGLGFLHENNYAHRDLKPLNILVAQPRPEWWVKIGDFGISKRLHDKTALRTNIGTPGYIAPEVIGICPLSDISEVSGGNQENYDTGVDIWALGTTIVRMFTQHALFPAPNDFVKYVLHELPFPRGILESNQLSEECYDFLENAMKPSPLRRLKAKAALAHPWLQMSRSLSRAGSSHNRSDRDSFVWERRRTLLDNGKTSTEVTEASLAWSTLDTPASAEKFNSAGPNHRIENPQPIQDAHDVSLKTGGLLLPEGPRLDPEPKAASMAKGMQQMRGENDAACGIIRGINILYHQDELGTNPGAFEPNLASVLTHPIGSLGLDPDQDNASTVETEHTEDSSIRPATPSPEVLARLSFEGIEDLASNILIAAGQIYKDTDIIEMSRAARDSHAESDDEVLQIRSINSLTTANSIKFDIANGALPDHQSMRAALQSRNDECLIALLQCDADPNAVLTSSAVPHTQTMLTFAASEENEFGVWALVAAGAAVNDGLYISIPSAPLTKAVKQGHVNIVRFLLANGAKPPSKYSPIYHALMLPLWGPKSDDTSGADDGGAKNVELANLLLKHGAKVTGESLNMVPVSNKLQYDYYNPFHFAASRGYDMVLTWLAEQLRPIKWEWYAAAIYLAVAYEHWECFDILKKPPYRATSNLHVLIEAHLREAPQYTQPFVNAPHVENITIQWDSFSRAIKELLSTGLDPRKTIKYQYRKRENWRSGPQDADEDVSAMKLVKNIESDRDRDRVFALFKEYTM